MPKVLKPQDVLVACYLATRAGREWPTHAALASALHLAQSTVHASLGSLRAARLVVGAEPALDGTRLLSFLVHGVPVLYYPRRVHVLRGTPTGIFSPAFRDRFTAAGDVPTVWPYSRGKEEGEGLLPLYPSVAAASAKDSSLYQVMAAVDVLRAGRAREREAATRYFEELLGAKLSEADEVCAAERKTA